jgi:hypothetical protein
VLRAKRAVLWAVGWRLLLALFIEPAPFSTSFHYLLSLPVHLLAT